MKRIGVSEAARRLTAELGREVAPREITLLFYNRRIPDASAPIRQGRRRIEPNLLPTLADALRGNGGDR